MTRIFVSFFSGVNDPLNKAAIPCFYESFLNGLKKTGCEVLAYVTKAFAADYKKIPDELLCKIKKFDPELIILFNNAFYDISNKFECPILIYEVDSPLYYSNKEAIKQKPDRYKFAVCQEESAKILNNEFKVNQKNILQASFFSEVINEKLDYKRNICFIGTKFASSKNKTPYVKFLEKNPNIEEKKEFINLLDKIKNNPFADDIAFNSSKIEEIFNKNELIFYLSDFYRTKTLSNISDLGLEIFGTKSWSEDYFNEPYLILNFNPTPVYSLKHNQDIYNSSKIGININHLQAKQGFSWRVCDIMASNSCLVSEYKPNLDKYFSELKIPSFTNPYEAREVVKRLLNNENLRQDIVFASNEIIDKKFRFKNIKEQLECAFNIKLSGNSSKVDIIVEEPKVRKIKLKYKIMLPIFRKLEKKLKRKGLI